VERRQEATITGVDPRTWRHVSFLFTEKAVVVVVFVVSCCCLLLLHPVVLLCLADDGERAGCRSTVEEDDDETTTTVKGRKGERGDKPGKSKKGRGKEMLSPTEDRVSRKGSIHHQKERENGSTSKESLECAWRECMERFVAPRSSALQREERGKSLLYDQTIGLRLWPFRPSLIAHKFSLAVSFPFIPILFSFPS
jgi:hypothetical protein